MMNFLIGDDGQMMSPTEVARQRQMASYYGDLANSSAPVTNWASGAARLVNALNSRMRDSRADDAEARGLAQADQVYSSLPGLGSGAASTGTDLPAANMGALDLIRQFEGYRDTPYWDVNAYRTGYGSDTVTMADGSVVPVSQGMQITRDDAERDLQRRVFGEFMPRAQAAAGARWAELSPAQQSVLTSLAYNYGSVPKAVAQAVQGGGDVVAAINSLSSHNDGVNASRRAQEAAIYGGGAMPDGNSMAFAAPSGGPSGNLPALLGAMSDPWVAQKYGNVLQALIGQQMDQQNAAYQQQLRQQDPGYRLGLQKAQLELDQMRQPQRVAPVKVGDVLLDGVTFEPIFDGRQPSDTRTASQKDYGFYSEQETAAGRTPLSFNDWDQQNRKAGATSVVVGGGDNKQVYDTMAARSEAARSAASGLTSIANARKAITDGAITGFGADARLSFQKAAVAMGLANPDAVQNTETFRSAIAPQVSAMLKATVGSAQISNSDREFAEKAAGGSISLDQGSILRLLDIMERGNRAVLNDYQSTLDRVYPDDGQFGRERALFGIPAAPQATTSPTTGQPVQRRRFNPTTGAFE